VGQVFNLTGQVGNLTYDSIEVITMADPTLPSSGHWDVEEQESNYHDDEPEIQNDEQPRQDHAALPPPRRARPRLPKLQRRFEED
jgi:hypothetical protein